jgi:methionyl-tRNA synthetase
MLLQERGYIYHSKHEGWYSVSDETFYPETAVEMAIDTVTGKKRPVSIETGKVVEWTSEINYKFRLSQFKDKLLDFYKENPNWIEPAASMNFIKQAVEEGPSDLSVSRPSERVQWGIPVPHDNSQNIYVWLDALMNYAVQTGYPSEDSSSGGWPADVQVIGKDILRFHCIYWPAFLMALELPLPKRIISHAHWTMGNEKMSKSVGNVVNPFSILENYGVDSVRWFLAHEGRLEADSDYNNLLLARKYEDMRGKLGNFLSRLIRAKIWSVPRALAATVPTDRILQAPSDPEDRVIFDAISSLRYRITPMVENYEVRAALLTVMDLIAQVNAWFHHREPWRDITKDGNQATMSEKLEMTLSLCAEALRISGIFLQPYMPNKAKQLLDQLGVSEDKRTWEDAVLGCDAHYGTPVVSTGKDYDVLFPKISLK